MFVPDIGRKAEGALFMRATRPVRLTLSVTAFAGLLATAGASGGVAAGSTLAASAGAGQAHVLSQIEAGPFAAPSGFAPTQIRNEYGFNAMGNDAHGNPIAGRGQIIGIVLWDSDEFLQSDMEMFLKTYSYLTPMNGLTAKTPCTVSKTMHTTPCFEVAYATGHEPPPMNQSSLGEASLDTQWAHVTAEGADILFVEAAGTTGPDLLVAVDKAVSMGATVVSMSWDQTGISSADNSHFDVSTAGFVSGSGDYGCPDDSGQVYPSGSADVLSVGGTQLTIDGSESSQTTWSKSGGYANKEEPRPGYQLNWSTDQYRTDNDVAYNAVDYPIVLGGDWYIEAGVSAGIPQWAGLVADADQARAALGKSVLAASGLNSGIYLAASDEDKLGPGKIDKAFFTDITTGSAGSSATCKASKGWDWPTGLGTPKANGLVSELADI
jgi:subtilase family serine protease